MACAATLEAHGWVTDTLDAGLLLGEGWGPVGETAYRAMTAVPGLYDAFHFAGLRTGGRLAALADNSARMRLLPKLREQLDRHPAELVITISPTGASAVSSLASRYPALRHVVFCTDVNPHRLWVHQGVDLYLVTSRSAEPAVRRFHPDARVLVIPPAVRPAFYRPPPKIAARIGLGIGIEDRCVLLISGSRGRGPVAETADALAAAGLAVLAVAGRNAQLERKLRAVAARLPRVQSFGFTDRMPELMAAADLVITSPGGTCVEARTVGRPLLLLDLVQGHGRDNLQHELSLGEAAVTSKYPGDVVRSALACLDRAEPSADGPTRSLADWEDKLRSALATIGV
jgi:processive 1,2-diacylglycerol beta-glucosyltransferase